MATTTNTPVKRSLIRADAMQRVLAFAALSVLLVVFSLPPENWWRLFAWLAIGMVIYFSYGRHHSVLAKMRAAGIERD